MEMNLERRTFSPQFHQLADPKVDLAGRLGLQGRDFSGSESGNSDGGNEYDQTSFSTPNCGLDDDDDSKGDGGDGDEHGDLKSFRGVQ